MLESSRSGRSFAATKAMQIEGFPVKLERLRSPCCFRHVSLVVIAEIKGDFGRDLDSGVGKSGIFVSGLILPPVNLICVSNSNMIANVFQQVGITDRARSLSLVFLKKTVKCDRDIRIDAIMVYTWQNKSPGQVFTGRNWQRFWWFWRSSLVRHTTWHPSSPYLQAFGSALSSDSATRFLLLDIWKWNGYTVKTIKSAYDYCLPLHDKSDIFCQVFSSRNRDILGDLLDIAAANKQRESRSKPGIASENACKTQANHWHLRSQNQNSYILP